MMYTKEQQIGKSVKKKPSQPSNASQLNNLVKKGSNGSGRGKNSTSNTKS